MAGIINMQREIKKYPDPILRKKSEDIKEINKEIKILAQEIIETKEINNGLGLAGPQIGVLKKIIVVQFKDGPRVFINPKIIEKSKETKIDKEGCLSFPGLYLKIKRAKEIKVEALDINGEKNTIKTEDLIARIFQHEIDHLNGILIIDRIGIKDKISRMLNNLIVRK